MSSSQETFSAQASQPSANVATKDATWYADLLRRAFDVEFSIVDGLSGDLLCAPEGQPQQDWSVRAELCREVARRGRAEFIDEEEPLVVLALPLGESDGVAPVAVGTFVTREVQSDEDLGAAARLVDLPPEEVAAWASRQRPWVPEMLRRVADMVLARLDDDRRIAELVHEARSLSEHLSSTYEEISLLYRLTQNLKLSQSDEQLGQAALEWLDEVVAAEGFALFLASEARQEETHTHRARPEDVLLTFGRCPIGRDEFKRMVDRLGLRSTDRPFVANRQVTGVQTWPCPEIRQLVVVPLAEGENLFGWLAAINHADGGEFGTVEANLLSSIGAILGIHSGNIDLYQQQSEMFAGIVRALTSAIDAKDEYTRGHSNRVAQVSVRLATELGCDERTINRIYLAGLLHDIGKIGVDDSVLRKPGGLTDEEYEHIKGHVSIGHRILVDLKKMDDVLPVVLHHHESWDGSGYPEHLPSEAIPRSARIVAVADAFDAMSSDRPYRKGMADEKIDAIFREGAGKQWDPDVVAALFRVRDDVREIVRRGQIEMDENLNSLGNL